MKSCHFYRIAQCSSKNSMTLSSFSMTFHDLCYLLSMTFQAWRIVYLNFMTLHEGRTLIDIQDIIMYATFGDDRLRGLGVARGRISHFPIDLRRRPYNTLALLWQCVITIYTTGTTGVGMNNNHSTVLLFPLICAFMQPQLPEYPRALASWISTASPVIILTQMCLVHSWMLLWLQRLVGWGLTALSAQIGHIVLLWLQSTSTLQLNISPEVQQSHHCPSAVLCLQRSCSSQSSVMQLICALKSPN